MNKKKIYCFIGFMFIIYKYFVMVINYNTMQNTQENSPPAIPSNLKPVSKLLRMLSQIPIRPPLREQVSTPVYALHIVLTLILYLSTKQINLLPLLFKVDNELVVIILLSTLLIIIIQCVIAILYNKQFFIKLQFMIYVYILYPIAIYFLLGFTGWQRLQAQIALAITVVISAIFTLLLQAFIGKQCYSSHLIVDTGLPLNFYIFLFSLSHYLFACTSDPYQLLAIFLMTLFSVYTKIGLVDRGFRRCKSAEYTLVRVQASLNLLYTSFILVQWISDSNHTESQPYIFIIPLVIFLIISEFMGQYADLMSPFTSDFFRQSDNKQKFLECAQYISDDLKLTNSTKNSQNIIKTCLIPLYYSHLKNCNPSFCRLSHELQPSVLSSLGNYKSLTKAAFNIIQMLFLHFLELYHNDIELRIAFLNFYSLWGQSNARMMQLLAQTQMSQLSLTQQIKLYQIKKCFGGGQMGDQTKVQDSCLGFNQNITSLMKLLIQFWSQFIEQRIDFQKVLQLSQKITPIMNNLQNQIEQTLKLETYSSIKILRVYSEYCRWILNDDVKSATVSDYTSFLTKKIAQVNEINSIAADMEIGLIAISLNFRKIGEIKIANSQAANIFNYKKQEFLKVNVNTLMPSLISKHHDDYLKAFISYSGRKVNTDRRLLLGKKKQNFIFQIYLQLQKSVITHTDELVFIANIELAKIKEAVILIVCDDKGLITDYNSTYYEIFQKVYKKGKKSEQKRYGNIQQLITNFFSIVLTQNQQPKSSIECFDNPVFGIIQIKFEIVKLSVKQKKDMGYIIKGYRIYETKQTFFNGLNISNELIEKSDERDLKGMKIQYSSASNQYHFNESLDIFNCGQFHSDFTIPYVKLEMLGSLITQKVQENYLPQYDTDIKTLRFFGDHFQRVQEIDSFQSEISEEEKANSKKNRFLIIKQKILSEKKNLNNKLPQALSLLLLTVNLIILIFFYITVSQEKGQIFTKTKQISEAYEFRAKLSEYIIYFQAQNDLTYGNFFKNNKEMLKSQLINDITSANLTQSQKQKALKVVYLQETLKNTTFQQLINDDVLYIQKDDQPLVQKKFVIFKVLFGIVLGLRLLANFIIMQWHKKKIINTFSLFLGLTEGEIKFSQQKCLKFLKHSNQSEKASNEQVEYEQVEDQNPHVKIKKFKNSSLLCQSSNWLKLNAFVFIFLAFFILVLVNDWKMSSQFETDKTAYDFVFTVMPEYSTVLMKIYSQKKQNINLGVKEHFLQKYQAIDFNLLTFTNQQDASKEQEKFMKIMMSDQCLNSSYMLPNSLRCQQVGNNIMKGGISKATNYLAHRLNNLKKQSSSSAIPQLNELTLLLYHLVQPKLKTISSTISQKLQSEYQLTNIFIMLYLIVMLTLSVSDAVYQHNYPLEEIQKNIVDSKILIGLLPEVKKKNKKGYTAL